MGARAVPAMAEALGDRSEAIRKWAATSLGLIGPAASPAVPRLA